MTLLKAPNGAPYPNSNEPMALTADRIRDLALWADPVGPRGLTTALAKDSAQNFATATWTSFTWSQISYTPASSVGGGGAGPNGITIKYTGLYRVTVAATFGGNATGRRGVGVATIGGAPITTNNVLRPPLGATASTPLMESFVVPCTAGVGMTACGYQDSGVTLTATILRAWFTLLAIT
jgi:hypothetical protein